MVKRLIYHNNTLINSNLVNIFNPFNLITLPYITH